jgi:hypothetical protein
MKRMTKCRTHNKPIAFMGVEVKAQTSVLRKNVSDYPQYNEFETATIASAKTLHASERMSGGSEVENLKVNKIVITAPKGAKTV